MSWIALANKNKSKNTWLKADPRHHHHHEDEDVMPSSSEAETIEGVLAQWTEIQRQACEAQVSLLRNLLESGHYGKVEVILDGAGSSEQNEASDSPTQPLVPTTPAKPTINAGPRVPTIPTPPLPPIDADSGDVPGDEGLDPSSRPRRAAGAGSGDGLPPKKEAEQQKPAEVKVEASPRGKASPRRPDISQELEDISNEDAMLEMWKRASGLHTVEKWASNYRKHPAGWGALLMIHGIPEVTGRLRSKVENYAIYSALFLSVSLGWLVDPPNHMSASCDKWAGIDVWICEIEKRTFAYLVALGTLTHMFSILLAMTFINVLNETARDSDVIRMFARGKGFVATVKVQWLFRLGCISDFLAMVVAAKSWVGWDMLIMALLVSGVLFNIFKKTSGLLWRNASIVSYWRADLGGKPDADDPYELSFPVSCLARRAQWARSFEEARAPKNQ